MPCRPNPSPDSAKVWLLPLPIDLSLHTYVSSTLYSFSTAVFFPFSSRLQLSPIHNTTQFSVPYTTSFFVFCFVFPIPLCSAPTPTFTYYACAQNHSRQNSLFSMAHVSNTCSTSTSWYGPLPSPSRSHVTSFSRNYYGKRGRRPILVSNNKTPQRRGIGATVKDAYMDDAEFRKKYRPRDQV